MFGWWKAYHIGKYIFDKVKEFIETGTSSFSFDISVKGYKYTADVTVRKKPQTALPAAKEF